MHAYGAADAEHACAVPGLQAQESDAHTLITVDDCPRRVEIVE